MKTLVINSGSSSLKFQLFQIPEEVLLCKGLVDRIGQKDAHLRFKNLRDEKSLNQKLEIKDHEFALKQVIKLIEDKQVGVIANTSEIKLIGHRLVHGGTHFSEPIILTDETLEKIDEVSTLAPLHNPHNLKGVKVTQTLFPKATQVGVFDTAFQHSIPEKAYRYAIPKKLADENGVRVYGFHGTSHEYITHQTSKFLKKPLSQTSLISLHLGNGCSMVAVKNGKCIDTSMGFSPLDGLVMGSRSGDLDPTVVIFLQRKLKMSVEEIDQLLNKRSGLIGLCGTNDLRDIIEMADKGNSEAELALEIYCYRIKRYIGSLMAVTGKLDAIVFTAGVGENASRIRDKSLTDLEHLGIEIDPKRNIEVSGKKGFFHSEKSRIKLLVIPTNEELAIARASYRIANRKH